MAPKYKKTVLEKLAGALRDQGDVLVDNFTLRVNQGTVKKITPPVSRERSDSEENLLRHSDLPIHPDLQIDPEKRKEWHKSRKEQEKATGYETLDQQITFHLGSSGSPEK